MPRWFVMLLGAATAVGSVIGFSRNYACAALPAGVLVMVVTAIADRVLFSASVAKNVARDTKRMLVALSTGVIIAFIPPIRLTPASAFRRVFGIPPPSGVSNLTADSRYVGGPGDHVILLSFQADQSTIDRLVAEVGMDVDSRYTEVWN